MDMLRAALERAITAREAMQVIIDLLEEFGQGGNCLSHGNEMYYHNSFLIANADDAWVLETVDKQWAARQIKDVYSISNCLTIGAQYDLASDNLVDFALEKGISKSKQNFHLARPLIRTKPYMMFRVKRRPRPLHPAGRPAGRRRQSMQGCGAARKANVPRGSGWGRRGARAPGRLLQPSEPYHL